MDELNRRVGGDGRWHCRACGAIAVARARAKRTGQPLPQYPPLIRGRSQSAATRELISKKRTAYLQTEQGQAHMEAVWDRKRGVSRSPQTRQRISEAKTGQPTTPAQQAAADRRRGAPLSEAAAADAAARRGRPDTIKNARRAGLAGKGVRKSPTMRAALSRAKTGVPLSAAHRAAISAAHLRWWEEATDEQRAARPYPQGPWPTSNTSIERLVAAALDHLGEPYEQQGRISRWKPDFVLEHRRLVIEADGTWWHSRPDVAAKDKRKDIDLPRLGYRVAHLTEAALKADALAAVTASLLDDEAPPPGS